MLPIWRQDIQFVRASNQNDERTAFIDFQLRCLFEGQMTHPAALNLHFLPERQAKKKMMTNLCARL